MYSMKEVTKILNLPASTIRYYDKQGLLPFENRTESGYRSFSEQDLDLLRMIECLKQAGMSIRDMREFTKWLQMGDESLVQRHEMFLKQRQLVRDRIRQMEKTLEVLDYKCWYYETAVAAGTEAVHRK